MAINAFTIISEFKFDVASAVVGSEQLKGSIDSLSDSTNRAVESVKALGVGFIANLSGGQAGLLGLLNSAISASDKFTDSQLSFATIIDSNMEHLTGSIHGLNEQMATSKAIMNDIAKDASKFGLPANALLSMTKSLTAELVPKGLAGENFGGARTLARNFLKSAPNLNIDPELAQGQLLRAIEGSASMGDTLFKRLVNEAPEAFKGVQVGGGQGAKGFNALDIQKRFEILNSAMAKFANNAQILDARANTLSGTIQRIKDLFVGFNSVLKPLGDVIIPFIVQTMNIGIKWLETHGRVLVQAMSDFIKPFLENPKELLLQVAQLQSVGGDFRASVGLTGLVVTLMHLKEAMHFLAKIPGVGPALAWIKEIPIFRGLMLGLGGVFQIMGKALMFAWPLFKIFISGLVHFSAGIAAFLIPLQGLSRAIARMKIDTIEWVANNMADLTLMLNSLKESAARLLMPIMDMIRGWEELFYSVIGGTFFLDTARDSFKSFADIAQWASNVFLELYAGFRGLVAGMMDVVFRAMENLGTIISNLMSGNITGMMDGTKNLFGGYMEEGAAEFARTMERGLSPNLEGGVDNAKVSNHHHSYDVKMTNNFKEVLQPDRIAFTIKDQLSKASRNRTAAAGASGLAGKQAGAI